jgi:5-methylcytosine-specific restriction endonuclease McrA
MADDRLYELLSEIERLRKALESIRDTPRRDGILTCQQIAVGALAGSEAVTAPREQSLGDPVYFRDVIQYLHWRYASKCAYCSASDCEFQIDHLTPVSKGGSDEITNLALACKACNQKKGAMTATAFGFRSNALGSDRRARA